MKNALRVPVDPNRSWVTQSRSMHNLAYLLLEVVPDSDDFGLVVWLSLVSLTGREYGRLRFNPEAMDMLALLWLHRRESAWLTGEAVDEAQFVIQQTKKENDGQPTPGA